MQPIGQAVLLSWSVPPAASFALALTALLYLRGWLLLRRAGLPYLPPWRAVSFLLGLFSVWIALASPLDTFSSLLLIAHMTQHMLLMMVAPPLILLGCPLIPLVRGLPIFAAREFAGPFLNWRVANRVGRALTQPIVALILMGVAMFAWHTPRLYELALSSGAWHEFEHACFFVVSLIFWWPVVQPWPSHAQWPRWAIVPYLLIGDLQNTALSAILIFSDRVIYPSYTTVPRLFDFSALQDQATAGAIMWAIGSAAFLVPAIAIAVRALSAKRGPAAEHPAFRQRERSSLDRVLAVSQRLSWGGSFLRRRFSSRSVEAISFLVLFAVASLGLAHLSSAGGDDDNQVLRLSRQSGPFAIAVFAPGDLEAGVTGVSVLVQDRSTQQLLTDATVELRAQSSHDSQSEAAVRATSEDSDNKLLQSAKVNFPAEGPWILNIAIKRDGQHADLSFPVQVAKAEPGMWLPWPYMVLMVLAAGLSLAYYRRRALRSSLPPSSTPVSDSRTAKLESTS